MSAKKVKIFIVDDDKMQSELLKDSLLKHSNHSVKIFHTGEECLKHLEEKPDIIFLDYTLSSENKDAKNGTEILKMIKRSGSKSEVVMFTGQEKIQIAVDTLTLGAFDYIIKNESAFHRAEIAVKNIRKKNKLEKENSFYKKLLVIILILIGIAAVVVFTLYQTGHITDNVGFEI